MTTGEVMGLCNRCGCALDAEGYHSYPCSAEMDKSDMTKTAMLLTEQEWQDLASLLRLALAQPGVVTDERAIAQRILDAVE